MKNSSKDIDVQNEMAEGKKLALKCASRNVLERDANF